jgi:hypothetical protein
MINIYMGQSFVSRAWRYDGSVIVARKTEIEIDETRSIMQQIIHTNDSCLVLVVMFCYCLLQVGRLLSCYAVCT